MTAYETYCQIRLLHGRGLSFNQIGAELGIDPETAAKYAVLAGFPRRRTPNAPASLTRSNRSSPAGSSTMPTAPPGSISACVPMRATPAASVSSKPT